MAKSVVIIGGGPGGYVAAIRCAQLGLKAILVEKAELGGTCLNRGCIPTKAVLQSVHVLEQVKRASLFGVRTNGYSFDLARVLARKDAVVVQLTRGVEFLLQKNGIEIIRGTAYLSGAGEVRIKKVDGQEVYFSPDAVIIATGSSPKPLSVYYKAEGIVPGDGALDFQTLPEKLLIVGAGAIGVEYATIFSSLGSEVTMVEYLPRILPAVDSEVALETEKVLKRKGIKVLTGAVVKNITPQPEEKILAELEQNGNPAGSLEVDKIIAAVGRKGNTEGLGLDQAGVKVKNGWIQVDQHMRTNVPEIYAIGDVVGGALLAHVASYQGMVAAENIAGLNRRMDYRVVPYCIFTDPEIAGVGLTEEQAREKYSDVLVGRFPYSVSGKAICDDNTQGFVKIIADKKYGEILGVHILGAQASALIGEAIMAMNLEGTLEEIAASIHPHPTLTEAFMESALSVLGRPLHS